MTCVQLTKLCVPLLLASVLLCERSAAEPSETRYPWPKEVRGANIILRSISRSDLEHLASDWEANSVRLMCGGLLSREAPYSIDTTRLERLEEVVGWCREYGLYTVVNLGQPDGRRDSSRFWETPELRARFVELWRTLARKYADAGPGLAYDLMNEPHGKGSAELWPALVRELTTAIREVDRVHPIVVEPAGWGNPEAFTGLEPMTTDTNTVYSFHFYAPFDFTHQRGKAGTLKATPEDHPGGLRYPGTIKAFWETAPTEVWNRDTIRARVQPAVKFREKYGVPVWVGEFGCTRWADGAPAYLEDCLDTWEELDLGWAYYSYREWYAMDLEQGTRDRSRRAPRYESELVKLFKRYFARNPRTAHQGPGSGRRGRR